MKGARLIVLESSECQYLHAHVRVIEFLQKEQINVLIKSTSK